MGFVARAVLLASITAACVGCDQVTKGIAAAHLERRPPLLMLGGVVRLSYAENRGAFLGLGATWPAPLRMALFVGVTLAMVAGMAFVALKRGGAGRTWLVALALVIGGGVGNLIDRIALGAVRDFLNVGVGPLRTGIFNGADLAISTGVALLLLARAEKKKSPASSVCPAGFEGVASRSDETKRRTTR